MTAPKAAATHFEPKPVAYAWMTVGAGMWILIYKAARALLA